VYLWKRYRNINSTYINFNDQYTVLIYNRSELGEGERKGEGKYCHSKNYK